MTNKLPGKAKNAESSKREAKIEIPSIRPEIAKPNEMPRVILRSFDTDKTWDIFLTDVFIIYIYRQLHHLCSYYSKDIHILRQPVKFCGHIPVFPEILWFLEKDHPEN